jgi:hypothetical protein
MAAHLLTELPWSAAESADPPLSDRLDCLREALAALAVAAATASRTPMGWFLGQCAAALVPSCSGSRTALPATPPSRPPQAR